VLFFSATPVDLAVRPILRSTAFALFIHVIAARTTIEQTRGGQ
jgi:hypothetical protein